jgi:hypothetical protein
MFFSFFFSHQFTFYHFRRAVPSCQKLPSDDALLKLRASVYADKPKKDIYNFVGNFTRYIRDGSKVRLKERDCNKILFSVKQIVHRFDCCSTKWSPWTLKIHSGWILWLRRVVFFSSLRSHFLTRSSLVVVLIHFFSPTHTQS